MKRELYRIYNSDGAELAAVMATNHHQHDPMTTYLHGVSASGLRKLASINGRMYLHIGGHSVLIKGTSCPCSRAHIVATHSDGSRSYHDSVESEQSALDRG